MPSYMSMFSRKYLGAWDAEDGELVATIKAVRAELLKRADGTEDKRPLLTFEDGIRPMILNKTNAGIIASMYGDDTVGWVGQAITLYRAQVEMAGKQVWALRVRVKVAAPPGANRNGGRKVAKR